MSTCHRFRATDTAGLRSLAKDVARLTADSFDAQLCLTLVPAPNGITLKGNKAVQNLVATRIGVAEAKTLMGPLVGIYDLRLSDAHLPSSQVHEAMDLVGLSDEAPFVNQGLELLSVASASLAGIADIIEQWNL